ncbi:serine hydrolase domain-containing protein [Streptomyces sp. NPDC047108]|uniref:serine hydrolase domain-containing protein n=1 Tax=Streptomyces sp. NPDC047108 TaxID=3155025 RepID=UPI00340A1B42
MHRRWMQAAAVAVTTASCLALGPSAQAGAVRTPVPSGQGQGIPTGIRAEVEAAMDAMVASGVPGATARVTQGGRTWTVTAGVADLVSGAPLRADGRFRAGSVTKELLAVQVLRLVDRGVLSLDDNLAARLPGVVVPDAERITVRQMLNHSSGLYDYATDAAFADPRAYAQHPYQPEELIRIATAHPPVAAPGEKFFYSNTNYIMLGLIVEKATGRELAGLLRDDVIDRAGMTDTFLPGHTPSFGGPHASGYYRTADEPATEPPHELTALDPSFAWSSYGLVSTTADLNRLQRALWDGRLLPRHLREVMTESVDTGNAAYPRYGLGLEHAQMPCSADAWGHTGSIPGFNTLSFADRRTGAGVTISANAQLLDPPLATPSVVAAMNAISQVFCGKDWSLPQ